MEKKGIPEEEIERRTNVVKKIVTMEWVGANADPEIILQEKAHDYYTYGKMPGKAYGYKSIVYRNLYPGIDVVYFIKPGSAGGFEYSVIIHPGADLRQVKMKFAGDVNKIKVSKEGSLIIKTAIDEIVQSGLASFNTNEPTERKAPAASKLVATNFNVNNNEVSFNVAGDYNSSKILVIDPFVSATSSLTGTVAGKAKDVDFDYAGNVYVTGGGDGNVYQMAKYNASGVLQWTFSGTVNNPKWTFGPYFGGWVVEKTTGNIYLGQGFDFLSGFIVVRISTTGLYDNYVTTGNPNFRENWKMIWNCNSGLPQIIVAGGGTNSNINLGLLAPPSVVPSAANITGIADIAYQDMADMVIDPLTNSMYTIYASGSVATLNNSVYKHTQPYSAATKVWNVPSGYSVLQEANNRPYLSGAFLSENSTNMLAINPSYLFYWDGKSLQAMSKATGAVAGTPITTGNTALAQGGIIADACNNVFVGSVNGTVKVYSFDGTVFNDATAPDISIPGFSTKAVYDLAYNETQKILYASGDGFVAAIDVASYCASTVYGLTVTPDCVNAAAAAVLNPLPPGGSTVTYALFTGTTAITSNTTGVFNALSPAVSYKIVATINEACSGTQSTASFVMPGPTVSIAKTDATCSAASGTFTATGSGTAAPYTYSIDGISFAGAGTFPGLAGGVYSVTVKDASGCRTSAPVTILNSNGPSLSFTQTNADCGSSNATVTASAVNGTAPYQYSINGGSTYQNSNFFTALLAGKYTLMVKDATGCTNASVVTITSSPLPAVNAIPSAATCGNANGLINAFGSGGTAPYQYSADGNNFQLTNTFANLTPGTYTVTVKDANGCSQTTTAIVADTPAPTVTAVLTQSACANSNGSVTATGTGGLAPLQYSINNGPFQNNNIFNGLLGGVYTISVQDIAGCIGSASVTVTSVSDGPTVTATATASACNVNNGTITAVAVGGITPYQYSLDNTTYQPGGSFSSLAAGNNVVFAKDGAGCLNTFSIVVPPTSGPALSSVPVTASSCTANDGTIVINATGGAAPLQFSVDGIAFGAANTFNGLAPNIYTAVVKDANGCSRSKTVTVLNASGLSLFVSALNTSCSGNSGSVTASASGGIAPLQYSLDGVFYQGSNTFSLLAAGDYTVYVKDANGCVVFKPATVGAVSAPSVNLNVLNASCATASGAIMAFGAGGILPLTYNIDGGAFSTIDDFVNLATGDHTVTVKDAGGCTFSQIVTITNSAAASAPTDVTFTLRNALPCTGGKIRIKNLKGVPSGGGNHYQFSLDFGTYTNSNSFINVVAGNHIVTAINDNGCTVSRVAVIGNGTPATATHTATGTACGTSTGSITITGVGANVPYHASIDNGVTWVTFFPPGANTFTFSGLAPGTHPIMIADDADFTAGPPDIPGACITTIFATVPTIGGPSVSTLQFDGTCAGNDGSITASGTGTAPLSYNINGGAYQSGGFFGNLASGIYTINLKDANDCVSSTAVIINNPSGPVVTATTTAASCNGNNGSITVTSTNGVNPVQYSIDGFNFQAGGNFTDLAQGSYQVYAKDANGCYNVVPVSVAATPLPQVTAFTVAASCGNSDGSIITTATGGELPYQYSLDGLVFQSSTSIAGLSAGLYTVTVKDVRGCTNTTGVVLQNAGAPAFTGSTGNATCGNNNGNITVTANGGASPYEYSIDGTIFLPGNIITNLAAGNSIVTVRGADGCLAATQFLIGNASGPQSLTAVVANAFCGAGNGVITATATGGVAPLEYSIDGITYKGANTITAVPAGNYTLYVRDANLCVKKLPVSVQNLQGPLIVAALPSPATCIVNDGTITVTTAGGTGSLAYSINGSPFQPGNIFTALVAGTYNITAQDAKGCSSTFNNIVVPALSNLSLAESHVNPTCGSGDGSITLTAAAGSAPYQYSVDGVNFQLSNFFGTLAAGTYPVTTKDASGCSSGTNVTIISPASNPKTWLGNTTDWQDAGNWCGGVPLISENVLIPAGLLKYPTISSGTGYSKNITIETGASVTVLAALQIADTIANQGVLNAVQGTIELIGTKQQDIAGNTFFQHTIHQLVISNTSAAGVVVAATPADTLKISRKLSFGFTNALFTTGDNVTLLSSDTATASVGIIDENPDGTPKATISGQMVVERYYPAKRAWRLITSPLKADAAAPTINAAWQEGANPPSVTGFANPDPRPGYGTHITGPYNAGTPYSIVVTDSGFDQSPQNNSSMKYYDVVSNSYKTVTNTYTSKVNSRQGYLLFVRGDRAYDISTTSNTVTPAEANLRAKGNVNSGMVQVPADTGLQVIGNPYPSAIKFDDAMFSSNAAILKNQSYWLWDPLKGSAKNTPTNVGGWIPVAYSGGGVYTSTYDPSLSVVGVESAHAFDIDGTIQSGAAFIVDNKATATGSFVMHEASKQDGSNNNLFRPGASNLIYLRSNLFRTDANKKPLFWCDGVAALMNDAYKNATSYYEDIRKIFSSGENLSIVNGGEKLAIERRKGYQAGDTVLFESARLKIGNYKWELFFKMLGQPAMEAFFEDRFTGMKTPVSFTEHTLVDVDVIADPASAASNRFILVFGPLAVVMPVQINLTAWEQDGIQLQWQATNQQNVVKYVVEESANGINFTDLITMPATFADSGKAIYNASDNNIAPGINYYRVRIVEQGGTEHYSTTVLVNIIAGASFLQVSPNPVQNGKIQLLLHQVTKGKYRYELFNATGQFVLKGSLQHEGLNKAYQIISPKKLVPGLYKLSVSNPVFRRTVLNVSVME